jgi:hypothetical protein
VHALAQLPPAVAATIAAVMAKVKAPLATNLRQTFSVGWPELEPALLVIGASNGQIDRTHGLLQPAPSVCAPMRSAGEADWSKSRSALRCGLVVLPVALSHAAVPSARTRLHAPRTVPCAGMGAIPCR